MDEHLVVREPNGRWMKGFTPNPAGRPKGDHLVRDAARSFTLPAIKTLAKVMNDEDAPHSARVQAAEALLNRGWGRPQQNIEAKIDVAAMHSVHAAQLIELTRLAHESEPDPPIDITPVACAPEAKPV